MLDALSAETMKLRRHKATWFLVWGYPIICTLVVLIAIALGLARDLPADKPSLARWIEGTTVVWDFARNLNGRYLIASYVAVVFAGEYGWNTWKLIIPHRARTTLIGAKYVVPLLLLLVAFVLTAILTVIGTLAEDMLTGDVTPAALTTGGILKVHGKDALTTLAPVLVTFAYASLAAVLVRSTIAALIIGIVATTIEQIIFNAGPALSLYFFAPVQALYHALPGYHLANLGSWIDKGVALKAIFPAGGGTVALSWATSLIVVTAWVGVLIASTFAIFRRQDIN